MCVLLLFLNIFYYVRDDTVTSRNGINKVFCVSCMYLVLFVCLIYLEKLVRSKDD